MTQILSRLSDQEFFNREEVARRLYSLAVRCKNAQVQRLSPDAAESEEAVRERRPGRALNGLLLGAPRTGKTEVLRKSFDRLFHDSDDLAPIYFSFRSNRLTVEAFAEEYFSQFMGQFLAFRLDDRSLLALAGEPVSALMQNTLSEDYFWVRNLVDCFARATKENDQQALLRCALNAPVIAASQTKVVPFVMLDNVHLLDGSAKHGDASREGLFREFIKAISL